ncbi:SDR family NAD(P)-dependent oxidoreductase [Embleya sp. NPDC005575]|uniref:SDR family NAD(P)-dependent oxidoreductase n=1 Tax=Embleya sp. NPDC005575 TaxID=3156892 RepID=UPI0033A017CD
MAKTALVTGTTGALSLALVRGLCRRFGDDGVVYLTSRDPEHGRAAVARLRGEGFAPQLAVLEPGDAAGVGALADMLADRHGGVDVVIAGAAARIAFGVRNQEQVRSYVQTDNHGTHRLIEAFVPLLADGARFVLLAGDFGGLRHLPYRLRARFDVDRASLAELAEVMDDYVHAVEEGRAAAEGWPAWIGVPSMIGRVAAMKILARDLAEDAARRDIVVNAASVCRADLIEPVDPAERDAEVERAAADVLWLATLAAGTPEPYGELVRARTVLPFRA